MRSSATIGEMRHELPARQFLDTIDHINSNTRKIQCYFGVKAPLHL